MKKLAALLLVLCTLLAGCGRHRYEVTLESRPGGGGWGWDYNPQIEYIPSLLYGQEDYGSSLFLPLMRSDAVFTCTVVKRTQVKDGSSYYKIYLEEVWFGQAPEEEIQTLVIRGESTLEDMEHFRKEWEGEENREKALEHFEEMQKESPHGYPQPHEKDRLIVFADYSEKSDVYFLAAGELSYFAINPPDDTLFPFCQLSDYLALEGKDPQILRDTLQEILEEAPNLIEPASTFGKIGEEYVGVSVPED